MKRLLRNIATALLCGVLAAPVISAQGRHERGTNGGRIEHSSGHNRGGNNRQSRGASQRPAMHNVSRSSSRPSNNGGGGRPGVNNAGHNRPTHDVVNTGSSHGGNFRPGVGNNGGRPGVNNAGHKRPENGNIGNHPNGSTVNNRPNGVVNNRPNGVVNNRPSTNGVRPGVNNMTPQRPGNNNHPGNHAPNFRPGNNQPGNHAPNFRPGNNNHPGNHAPGFRPSAGHQTHRPPMMAPPHRPFRPPMLRPPHRPMPPRGWRPAPRVPIIRGILGLTFGTAINLSLDYLFNAGYTVDGYTNDVVYLRNVSALNYIWTDAALYYGSNGLDASSFYYSTPGYDLARYNNVYNALVATYGAPVTVNNSVNSIGATWFGGNNGYITLSFGSNNLGSGLRYLTTLTFGL